MEGAVEARAVNLPDVEWICSILILVPITYSASTRCAFLRSTQLELGVKALRD